jgi:protein-tyrosine phosphatase
VYILLRLFGFPNYARQFVVKNSFLVRDGLFGLYISILDSSQPALKKIFDILAVEASYPVIIHCSAGKDRTGVVVALIQKLVKNSNHVMFTIIIRKLLMIINLRPNY